MADTDKKFLDDDGVSQFAEETKNYVDNKVSQLDDKYIRSDDTTIIRLRNQNEINLQEDHNNAWFGYRDGKVTNWKFGDGTEGGLADVYVKDLYLGDEKLSETYIRVDDTTIVKLVNDNEINLQEDHNNAWFGYRDGKVTNWKFGDGTEGGLADVYVKDLYLGDEKLSDLLGAKANDDDVVHKSGDETVDGVKTFNNDIVGNVTGAGALTLQSKSGTSRIYLRDNVASSYPSSVNLYSKVGDNPEYGVFLNGQNFHPNNTNVVNLGTNNYRWANVFTTLINGQTPAYDGSVVHNTGNETIGGDKTFTSSVKLKSNTIDNTVTPTTNLFKNLYVTDKNDVALSSLYYAQRTNNNREFNLQVSHPNSSDVLNLNLVHSGTTRSVVFQGENFVSNLVNANLGTTNNKWKTINGINPGALSLPGSSFVNVDTTGWDLTCRNGLMGSFTPTADGWLMLQVGNSGTSEINFWVIGGVFRINSKSTINSADNNNFNMISIPVEKDVTYKICGNASEYIAGRRIAYCRFMPCQGNV